MEEASLDQILSILERKKNIVLQGPPGTGKTFIAKRLAFCAMGAKDNSKVDMVQFHQSFSYEDFIQGYRPTETGNFSLVDGVFYRFCKRAKNDPNNKYFFIIDEINRGNLSKIFGELMLLIEGDKRGEHYAVSLTYQSDDDEQFYVPSNVYVIGTMNTADRSLAVVDYALRRRFSFISIHPKFNNQFKNFMSKYLDNSFIDKISERLTTLNEEINSDVHLGDGFLIGHSYFCSTENIESPELWYEEIVQFELEPLLNEYWFDEPEKVRSAIERLLQ
jgi:5-methylcytosine-specific restriction endonuclease McrBC GTP-binding regulatory subunit McrB